MQTDSTPKTIPQPLHLSKVELLVGQDVFSLLTNEEFKARWDILYSACSWATVFQSREFVTAWYNIYQKEYLPILVKTESNGQLQGLLTLALKVLGTGVSTDLRNKRVRIVGAGHFEAEYQAWLTADGDGFEFINNALSKVLEQYPKCDILLRYIPAQVPVEWASTNPQWKSRCIIEPFRRPLMDLHDPDLSKMFRKSEFRNKLNRLKKLGELQFEEITDLDTFIAILPELTVQFDFRQGAMFNKNRFKENPLKSEFLIALFQQNLLHVTLLRTEQQILAAIVALAGKDWVHLGGINIHSPLKASYYSPGFVHFLMLGQRLSEAGYATFDLTPGGDSYKERLATTHDFVYELTVTNNPTYFIKRGLRKSVHNTLIRAGLRPMSVELSVIRKVYLLKAKLKVFKRKGLLRHLIENLPGKSKAKNYKVYQLSQENLGGKFSIEARRNSFKDLLDYSQGLSKQTRWEFLEDAMHRFEIGEQSFTWAEDGVMLACAWLSEAKTLIKSNILEVELPETAQVLQIFCFHQNGKAELECFIASVAGMIHSEIKNAELYAITTEADKSTNRALHSLGREL
ncbi:GNAT family N-acetyltransferase [Pontibacter sp. BT310]|uniref:GNAT family N-acetyltransferase n=1 Tax=Pontibacter populi TaxID=890055 RepID=A0ABS6XB23_9BACT|nr:MULTISPECIES: GNAT family N-acetyltransferase [Pontibacter]MBJ6118249.1 GNAT family N-acetyltransferase [Pontibacter sp. BT310]MBR0570676.1 GNAT family N-acetyltransferase [Microvirga sp. STS03]MBW3365102.1 GNAT family N-acetyltransferase [Pontibacter populi]